MLEIEYYAHARVYTHDMDRAFLTTLNTHTQRLSYLTTFPRTDLSTSFLVSCASVCAN